MRQRLSSKERERDKYTSWRNDAPITDIHEALDILWLEPHSQRERHIQIANHLADPAKPELHADWYTEGDSGGDMSGWHYFQIDPALVKKLRDEEYLEPRKILFMGGFYLEHEKLVLSEKGKAERKRLQEEKKQAAIKLMRPGIYETLPPPYDENRVFGEREYHGYGGRLYFTFRMLNGDEVRVFPDTAETEVKSAKKAAAGA